MVSASAVLAVMVIVAIAIYNHLVQSRNGCFWAWSQLQTQLRSRHYRIADLLEMGIAGAARADCDEEAFLAVTEARAAAVAAAEQGPLAEWATVEHVLTDALRSWLAVTDTHLELTANPGYRSLRLGLISTGDRVSFADQGYNNAVARYNSQIRSFQGEMVAGLLRSRPWPSFEMSPGATAVPVRHGGPSAGDGGPSRRLPERGDAALDGRVGLEQAVEPAVGPLGGVVER